MASGAMLLPNSIQVMESISGSVVPLAMFFFVQGNPKKMHHKDSDLKSVLAMYIDKKKAFRV